MVNSPGLNKAGYFLGGLWGGSLDSDETSANKTSLHKPKIKIEINRTLHETWNIDLHFISLYHRNTSQNLPTYYHTLKKLAQHILIINLSACPGK